MSITLRQLIEDAIKQHNVTLDSDVHVYVDGKERSILDVHVNDDGSISLLTGK